MPRYHIEKILKKIFERQLDQLLCYKKRILGNSIQWISITLESFGLIYGAGSFGLYGNNAISDSPIRSKLAADYGEWAWTSIPRIKSGIVDEIMRDIPHNPEAFLIPLMRQVNEYPIVIVQDHSGDDEPPKMEALLITPISTEPTSSPSPDPSPTSEPPVVTQTPQPTPTLSIRIEPTNTPTNSPPQTQSPTNAPDLPPPTQSPTNTPAAPSPTVESLMTICHKPGKHNQKTMYLPEAEIANHLAHGDYLGGCTNP